MPTNTLFAIESPSTIALENIEAKLLETERPTLLKESLKQAEDSKSTLQPTTSSVVDTCSLPPVDRGFRAYSYVCQSAMVFVIRSC
jgi:hypothetical protein